ncbi:SCO2522 family protein [Actinoplanes sp. KI2]|uniref:SCO2522 family protein n=1 Tax=Actinoplanes sp. KI2 TaxID=2983315 RepID=UPI0021D5F33A|nr:SCO2522 family protein [Actinoplanes sp. KI2]MCU7728695.1 SCO2522 family protein [Actinoplanes sp. KI2]
MTTSDDVFTEESAQPSVRAVALSHLSVELGHLYMDDFVQGPERLREHFRRVAPWLPPALGRLAAARPRVSTCFLIDDYFTRFSTPCEVVPALVDAAAEHGLTIDYVARESGCARVGDLDLAAVVQAHIVDEPPAGATGGRPPTSVSGWLTNGERSPATAAAAMSAPREWLPPRENAVRNHSIFVDVELWSEEDGVRLWSCPFLAAVWQLQRLGLLRHRGEPVAEPVPVAAPEALPADWDAMPAVVRLNPKAQPFRAYRTFSVLDRRFLTIEHAVRTILGQIAVNPRVAVQVLDRAAAEGLDLPAEPVERISYVFD